MHFFLGLFLCHLQDWCLCGGSIYGLCMFTMLILDSLLELQKHIVNLTKRAHKILLEYSDDGILMIDNTIRSGLDAFDTLCYCLAKNITAVFVLRWFDVGLEKRKVVTVGKKIKVY